MKFNLVCGVFALLFALSAIIEEIHGEPQQRSRLRLSNNGVTPSSSSSDTVNSSSHPTDGPLTRLRRPTRRTTTAISTPKSTTIIPQGQSSSTPTSTPINHKNQQQRQNNDANIRKEMIEKLCNRKHGAAETSTPPKTVSTTVSTTTTTKPATTATFVNDNFSEPQRTLPRNPLRRSQSHVRVPRRVKKLYRSTTSTTTTSTTEASNFPPFSSSPSSSAASLQRSASATTCTDFDHLTNEQLAKRVKGGLRRKHKPEN